MTYLHASTRPRHYARLRKGLLIVLGVLLYLAAVPDRSSAQGSCEQALVRANGYYYDARFDDGIALLKHCLDEGAFSQEEQLQAYTLLSMTCFANRQEADARQAIQILLELNPDYEPDPIRVQPSYRALVEAVRRARSDVFQAKPSSAASTFSLANTTTNVSQNRRGLSKWIYFGGGAILTTAAVLLISSASGSNPPPGPGQGPPPR